MPSLSDLRRQGVRIPDNQSTEQAPTMKVTNVAELTPVLIEYGDERGMKQTTIAFRSGDKFFLPKDHLAVTAAFRQLNTDLCKQAIEKLEIMAMHDARVAPSVPKADDVDVMGDGGLGGAFEEKATKK